MVKANKKVEIKTISLQEGKVKKGGVGTCPTTPPPAPPKGQGKPISPGKRIYLNLNKETNLPETIRTDEPIL